MANPVNPLKGAFDLAKGLIDTEEKVEEQIVHAGQEARAKAQAQAQQIVADQAKTVAATAETVAKATAAVAAVVAKPVVHVPVGQPANSLNEKTGPIGGDERPATQPHVYDTTMAVAKIMKDNERKNG